jgi:hypothetical protein
VFYLRSASCCGSDDLDVDPQRQLALPAPTAMWLRHGHANVR